MEFTIHYSPAKERLYDADEVDSFIEDLRDHRAEYSHSRYLEWLYELDKLLEAQD